jgi:hypothetical protein
MHQLSWILMPPTLTHKRFLCYNYCYSCVPAFAIYLPSLTLPLTLLTLLKLFHPSSHSPLFLLVNHRLLPPSTPSHPCSHSSNPLPWKIALHIPSPSQSSRQPATSCTSSQYSYEYLFVQRRTYVCSSSPLSSSVKLNENNKIEF